MERSRSNGRDRIVGLVALGALFLGLALAVSIGLEEESAAPEPPVTTTRPSTPKPPPTSTPRAAPFVRLSAAGAFDPEGDGRERDEEARPRRRRAAGHGLADGAVLGQLLQGRGRPRPRRRTASQAGAGRRRRARGRRARRDPPWRRARRAVRDGVAAASADGPHDLPGREASGPLCGRLDRRGARRRSGRDRRGARPGTRLTIALSPGASRIRVQT